MRRSFAALRLWTMAAILLVGPLLVGSTTTLASPLTGARALQIDSYYRCVGDSPFSVLRITNLSTNQIPWQVWFIHDQLHSGTLDAEGDTVEISSNREVARYRVTTGPVGGPYTEVGELYFDTRLISCEGGQPSMLIMVGLRYFCDQGTTARAVWRVVNLGPNATGYQVWLGQTQIAADVVEPADDPGGKDVAEGHDNAILGNYRVTTDFGQTLAGEATFNTTNVICGAADTTSPIVEQTLPVSDARNITVDPFVLARFSEPLQHASVNSDTVFVTDQSGQRVPGALFYDPSNGLAWIGEYLFQYNTTYTAHITGVLDLAGNPLQPEYKWSFTTEPDPPPHVLQVVPDPDAENVAVRPQIVVTFSEPLQPTSVNTDTIHIFRDRGAQRVPATFQYTQATSTLTITPELLEYATGYTILLMPGLTDLAGIHMREPFSSSFTTQHAIALVPIVMLNVGGSDPGNPTPTLIPPLQQKKKELGAYPAP